uniref:Uncharacterized protein n=1 Tax=Aegilops tauschii subsp. strangulata TaxID=200361 RepID=A0A453MRF8_AEGTS
MTTWYESSTSEYHKLLISLLKILCQQNGKVLAPFGSDSSQEVLSLFLMLHFVAVIVVLILPFYCVPVSMFPFAHNACLT